MATVGGAGTAARDVAGAKDGAEAEAVPANQLLLVG